MQGISIGLRQSALLIMDVLPWMLTGACLAALLRRYFPAARLQSLSRLNPAASIPIASLAGAASPLCTLGTLPIVTALVSRGLGRQASLAFLASSSIVTPQIALLTAGFLGPRIAIGQVAGGILAGIAAGALAPIAERRITNLFRDIEREDVIAAETGSDCSAGRTPMIPARGQKSLARIAVGQLEYGLFWLAVAVTVSQCALALIDAAGLGGLAAGALRGNGGTAAASLASLAGALISGPAYSCGGAVMPVLASLRSLGIDDSFVMAFLICGPATRIRSAAAVGGILTRRGLALYLGFIFAFSVFWSILYSLTFGGHGFSIGGASLAL